MKAEYVDARRLETEWPARKVGWSYSGIRRSLITQNGLLLKAEFDTPERTEELIRLLRSIGYARNPSGWAETFHAFYGKKFQAKSYTCFGPSEVYGPWEEGLTRSEGIAYRQFDLVTAYGWGGLSRPLPDSRFARPVSGAVARPRLGQVGIWFGTWSPGKILLPPHLRGSDTRPTWCTSEEILELDLVPLKTKRGIIFEKNQTDVADALKKTQDLIGENYKEAWRRYWGIFAAPHGPEQSSPDREPRVLPNPFRNVPLAAFIEARVRNRVAQAARGAAMIYVDAVLTAMKLRTGSAPGDWREVPIGKAAQRFSSLRR